MSSWFDLGALFAAIDSERQRRGLTWTALDREVPVSVSTIRRFEHADDAEADGVLVTIRWLNTAPEDYVAGSTRRALLPQADGFVRVDMERVASVRGGRRSGPPRTRTTIQNLVRIADRSSQPVAALTMVSKT